MLTLYYKPTCPYCQFVLGEAEDMGLSFNLKDISRDPHLQRELIERGGKQQVPYLIDDETGTEMYESDDIVAYLRSRVEAGPRSFGGLQVHRSEEVCESCQ